MASRGPIPPAQKAGALLYLAPPVLLALLALSWVWDATNAASWSTLGRDQGIFQYIAWAVTRGDLLYRDVRDVNGPVVTLVHYVFLALGGANEHRFRVLDLLATGLSFAISGALLPSIVGERRSPRVLAELAWALAAWVALSGQYLVYGFWDTAQRESFLDWFMLVSIALQATRYASADPRVKSTELTLMAAGLLSFVPWLGKPTYAIFTASQLVTLAVEPFAVRDRLRRLGLFCVGGFFGLALPLMFVVFRGDLHAWLRITFVDVPAMYRFIWPRPAMAILSLPGYASLARSAVVTTTALGLLVVLRRMPLRAIPIATMPMLGLVSVVAQAKGFPYHFHPVTLGITFGWLVVLAAMNENLPFETRRPWLVALQRAVLVVAALLFAVRSGYLAWLAPDPPAVPSDARDAASLDSAERLAAFERIDYFPRAMRDAAEYVAASTAPDQRVQLYGMDAYILFLAQRRSATPYIYAYDLNADAALHGSFDDDGPRPSAADSERIRAMRDEHASDLRKRLEAAPPAAFVFADRSPLMSREDALEDFRAHCAETAAWVERHYRQAADFDGIRVWLPRDAAR